MERFFANKMKLRKYRMLNHALTVNAAHSMSNNFFQKHPPAGGKCLPAAPPKSLFVCCSLSAQFI